MSIEDLKELKQWFADLTDNSLIAHGNGQYEPVDQDKVNAVNELIDAEIKRRQKDCPWHPWFEGTIRTTGRGAKELRGRKNRWWPI